MPSALPQYHTGHLPTGGTHLQESYLFAFHTVNGVLMARILEWIAISSSSGPCVVRIIHYDLSILGGPAWPGSALLSYASPFAMKRL